MGAIPFSGCKFNKILFSTKQNAQKIAEMLRKTTNAPEKNLSSPRRLDVDVRNLSPDRAR